MKSILERIEEAYENSLVDFAQPATRSLFDNPNESEDASSYDDTKPSRKQRAIAQARRERNR